MDENTGLYVTCRRVNTYTYIYRVFEEESDTIQEKVPQVKLHNCDKTYLLHIRGWMFKDTMARVFF